MRFKIFAVFLSILAVFIISLSLSNNQRSINPENITGDYNSNEIQGIFNGQEVFSKQTSLINPIITNAMNVAIAVCLGFLLYSCLSFGFSSFCDFVDR